ncbi:MAG: hypothetical protein E6H09_05585 [Bacteroidetes bacterium]|jgi:hypothetical protein|nr:MAG: hypothetical protein E6H09_05585 [Bacteroidota bacterium]
MLPEEPSLFELRFTEEGKKFIRKFAAISYIIMVLVIIQSTVIIYWQVKMIIQRFSSGYYAGYKMGAYDEIYPYLSIFISLLGIISNIYYTRFPRQLFQSIKTNDEAGANQSFRTLLNGAVIYLIYLLIIALIFGWHFIAQAI